MRRAFPGICTMASLVLTLSVQGRTRAVEPLVVFTNPVQSGTLIRAADVSELRIAANELRAAGLLAPFGFTDGSLAAGSIRAVHVTELRTAVDAARVALGLPAIAYTDPSLVAGITPMKAVHLNELRTAVVLPEGVATLAKPVQPLNFYAAGISPSRVFLKWSPSASPTIPGQPEATITGYRVFRDGLQIATVTDALRYEDAGQQPDTAHQYAVVAVDNSGRLSPMATATASTIPTMPAGGASVHPVLYPAGKLAALAAGGSEWNAQKLFCDNNLNTLLGPDYAGWAWHDAAISYSTCYQVAKLQGDTGSAQNYAKKALALAKVLARHHNYGTSNPSGNTDGTVQPIGLANGAQTTFPLPFAPMTPAQVKVTLVPTSQIQRTRSATEGSDELGVFAPIMKISNTSNGAANYAPADYELRFRDGSDVWRLAWPGANKPANGATYFVTVANPNAVVTNVASGGYTLNVPNLTLTFNAPPAANQVVMVSYIGTNYDQTGNLLGGRNAVQPDGPGYQMRTFNPGLASAYDSLLDSGLLTNSLKTEFYGVLNQQVEWCRNYCYENDGTGGQVGNYFIRGLLGGTFYTAYGTGSDNPQAAQLKTDANTLLAQMYEGIVKYIPGGYGPQGQYANGTTSDILEFLSLYRDVTGLDLIPRPDWTTNVVPATIHATKPDLATFYDGGDWDELPAAPLETALQAFLQYQPNHDDAPFARKLVQELGATPASSGAVTDYRTTFPLSYFGQASPFYARSDWGANAVWMSLTANDIGSVVHQHRDAGHFTINRGGDYLLEDAGGYGFVETLYHNSLLIDDRDIPGHDPVIVYPPNQGDWGREAQLTRHADGGSYAYAQADFAAAYINNDGERNSVTRALRSMVFLRPGTFVVFDQIQVAHPAILKTFNVNFAGTLTPQGATWSSTLNQSKLFMQTLLSSATPVTAPLPGSSGSSSTNFQETISGNLDDVFLHVFEATGLATAAMTPANVMKSVDGNLKGVEIDAGGRRWTVLFAAFDRTFGGPVQYKLPSTGAHTHLVHDLVPLTAYVISITNAQGQPLATLHATTDLNGTLAFDSLNAQTYFYVTPGTTAPVTIPPVTTDPNL